MATGKDTRVPYGPGNDLKYLLDDWYDFVDVAAILEKATHVESDGVRYWNERLSTDAFWALVEANSAV